MLNLSGARSSGFILLKVHAESERSGDLGAVPVRIIGMASHEAASLMTREERRTATNVGR